MSALDAHVFGCLLVPSLRHASFTGQHMSVGCNNHSDYNHSSLQLCLAKPVGVRALSVADV